MTRPEQIGNEIFSTQPPLTEVSDIYDDRQQSPTRETDTDLVIKKYAGLVKQYPQLGIHLSAVEQLGTHKNIREAELGDEDLEALLMYSVWSEDSVAAVEIAERTGLSERRLNEYVDIANFEMEPFNTTLLGIVSNLRLKTEAVTIQTIAVVVEPTLEPEEAISVPAVVNTFLSPVIDRKRLYRDTEQAPIHGTLAQSYDHPILNSAQERTLFGYLKSGASIEDARRDTRFINLFAVEDRSKIIRILDQSTTVEEALTSCYLRLVDVIARSYRQVPLQDAINAGNIGLLQAARKWEPGERGRFSTYAVWAIRTAVLQELYNTRSSVRIPAYVQQDMSKAKWVADAFQAIFGRKPTNEELRKQLLANTDMPRWRVNTLIQVIESKIQHIGSINTPISPDSDGEDEIADFVADTNVDVEGSVIKEIADEELRRETRRALAEHLTSEEQQVIRALYDLDGVGEKTSEEVAQEIGATPEVIIDIERRSLGKLRFDEWLKEHWVSEVPSFVYSRSAESAAFRLGLFDNYEIPKIIEPALAGHPLTTAARSREIIPTTVSNHKAILQATSEAGQSDGKVADDTIILKGGSQDYCLDLKFLRDEKVNPKNLSFDDLTTPRKIAVLRNAGLHNKQIAEILELRPSTVGKQASELLKQDLIQPLAWGRGIAVAAVTSHQKEILELLERGYSELEIGKRFGVTKAAISHHVRKLVKSGVLDEIKGEMDKSHWEAATSRIKELRLAGWSYSQIAAEVGLSKETVGKHVKRLIEEGQLEPPKITSQEDVKEAAITEETKLVGQYLEAHPRPSFKDGFRRIFEARERRPKGKSPRTIEFDKQVLELIQLGFTRKKTAEKLRVPATTIDGSITRMVSSGEYTPGKAVSSEAVVRRGEYYKTREQIKTMIQKGLNVIQIAESLDDTLSHVRIIVWRLAKKGEITPTTDQIRPANLTGYVDQKAKIPAGALSEVYTKVAAMRKQGLGNSEIAKELNLPVHRVEQYASNLIRVGVIEPVLGTRTHQVGVVQPDFEMPKGKNYDRVVELRNQGLNNEQIAVVLKIPVDSVAKIASRLIRAGTIKPLRLTAVESTVLRTQIKRLRAQKIGNQEIARSLNQPISRINNLAMELIRAGEIKSLKPGRGAKRAPSANIADVHNKLIEI